jgi:hypothetical protein
MQVSLWYPSVQPSFPQVAEQPVRWGKDGKLQRAKDHKAIVDLNTGKVFSIVSNDYKLIRHEEAIEKVERFIHGHNLMSGYVVDTEFYNERGRMRRTYRFPSISVKISKDDTVCLTLHLFNSYDLTWPFIVLVGAFRYVCANGLVIGRKYYQFRKRHIFHLEDVGLEADLDRSIGQFNLQANVWRQWAEIPMSMKAYDRVMRTMQFGRRAAEEIEERIWEDMGASQAGVPLISLWAFYNVLAWYMTHRAVSLNHRVEMENKLRMATGQFRSMAIRKARD